MQDEDPHPIYDPLDDSDDNYVWRKKNIDELCEKALDALGDAVAAVYPISGTSCVVFVGRPKDAEHLLAHYLPRKNNDS